MKTLDALLSRLAPIISEGKKALSEYLNSINSSRVGLFKENERTNETALYEFEMLCVSLTDTLNRADAITLEISALVRAADSNMDTTLLHSAYRVFEKYNELRAAVLAFLETKCDSTALIREGRALICAIENFEGIICEV